jgi:hypothetical protein
MKNLSLNELVDQELKDPDFKRGFLEEKDKLASDVASLNM